jgi:acyl-CoA synthetase (NDP forming)
VIARPDGCTVADARLLLRPVPEAPVPVPALDAAALFAPRTVAVAGASTNRPGFGNRALAAYRACGRTDDDLLVVHPSAASVDGVRAVASLAEVEGGVDYLLAAVPAAACPDLVRSAAGRARVVHVLSGGFAESGPAGAVLEDELGRAAREAGVRVVGPNCIGVYAPGGRQAFQLDVPTEVGGVHVTSQSGGLAGDVVKVGAARGLRFAHVLSLGNAVDVSPAEVLELAVADPAVRVVGAYLEGNGGDGERLVGALRAARGVKPVVVLTGGLSVQGSQAAASHTGALTGDRRVWEAVRRATNVAVVERLEDLLGALVFAQVYADHPASGDPATLLVGVGGGASVLGADACDRAGLELAPVVAPAVERLRALGYGAGTSVANPIEIGVGPAAPVDVVQGVLDAILPEQPFPDIIVHVNVQSYYGYGTAGIAPLCDLIRSVAGAWGSGRYPASRVVLVARNLDVAPGPDVDAVLATAIGVGLPVYRTFDEAAVAVAAGKEFARGRV